MFHTNRVQFMVIMGIMQIFQIMVTALRRRKAAGRMAVRRKVLFGHAGIRISDRRTACEIHEGVQNTRFSFFARISRVRKRHRQDVC